MKLSNYMQNSRQVPNVRRTMSDSSPSVGAPMQPDISLMASKIAQQLYAPQPAAPAVPPAMPPNNTPPVNLVNKQQNVINRPRGDFRNVSNTIANRYMV